MFTCFFCGWQTSNESARICAVCGPSKNWLPEEIDQPEALRNYQTSVRKFYFDADELEVDKFCIRLRERLKISFNYHQLFISILAKEKLRTVEFGQFRLEFDSNVSEAYAGHDTYLRFRFTNTSEEDFFDVNLDWDDPETLDELDLHIQTRQPVKPGGSQQIGGSHIFPRVGFKEISDLRLTVTNQFDESVVFRADSFTFKVGNLEQQVTNLTHNQISIEGRGVVDASGMGVQPVGLNDNKESWAELKCNYLASPDLPPDLNDQLQNKFFLLKSEREEEEKRKEIAWIETEKLERERLEKEEFARQEAERLERERLEKEEFARQEAERLERERLEKEEFARQEAERLERDRLEKEEFARQYSERLERERAEKEKFTREQNEKLKLQQKVNFERQEEERLERERSEKEVLKKQETQIKESESKHPYKEELTLHDTKTQESKNEKNIVKLFLVFLALITLLPWVILLIFW